jgi:Mrp family chromosome partitioning ATPase
MALNISAPSWARRLHADLRRNRRTLHVMPAAPAVTTPFDEAFRLLALNVHDLLPPEGRRAIVVMSVLPGDGRSTVAANLAIALAQFAGEVLLVDGANDGSSGLSGLLPDVSVPRSTAHLPEAIREQALATSHPGVWLMPLSGPPLPNGSDSTSLPASSAGGHVRVLEEAGRWSMLTVIDSPACLTSSEGFFLARWAGNVLFVVRGPVTDLKVHQQAIDQLQRFSVRVLGTVFNEARR